MARIYVHHREHGDVVFSLCREMAAKGGHQPYRANIITFPAGAGFFAHRRLPRRMQMLFTGVSRWAKKDKTLCALCGSAVNQCHLKYVNVIMN